MAERRAALVRVPLFSSLPKRHLHAIARVAGPWSYAEGATLVKEGDSGSTFFVILEGRTRVVRRNRTVRRMSEGDFFGEISLLDPGPRTATVVAESPIVCLELTGEDFLGIVSREPRLATAILRVMARRLREAEHPLVG
jgi:CRP/FNR family transcriptional regulator, cyclic AMP receptor protein